MGASELNMVGPDQSLSNIPLALTPALSQKDISKAMPDPDQTSNLAAAPFQVTDTAPAPETSLADHPGPGQPPQEPNGAVSPYDSHYVDCGVSCNLASMTDRTSEDSLPPP